MAKHLTGKNGVIVSDKATVNFIAGTGITLTITEDADSVNVQIDSSATLTYATTSDIADVASAESAGAATTVPRGDHVHAHETAHLAHDTLWDTKGDIVAATGADTAAKLAVGSNLQMLASDSATSSGLRWTDSITRTFLPNSVGMAFTTHPWGNTNEANMSMLSTQRVSLTPITLPIGAVISNITFFSGGTALSSGNHQYFGLYDSTRTRLAVTADDTSTAWAARTKKTLALTSPYTVTATGLYYVAILVDATTVPTIVGDQHPTNELQQAANLGPHNGTSSTGQTSLPTNAGAITEQVHWPFVALT